MKQLAGLLLLWTLFSNPIVGQLNYHSNDYPNPSNLLVGKTAYNLPQGALLYKNTMLFLNSLTYGISDQFSIGVGTELYSPVFEKGSRRVPKFVTLAPKIGYQLANNVGISAGCEMVVFTSRSDIIDTDEGLNSIVLGYSLLTFGAMNSNFTLGIYSPSINWDLTNNGFIYNFGCFHRMGKRYAFVAECFFVPGAIGLLDAGLRLYGRRVSVDLGLAGGFDYRTPVPIIDFAWRL